MAMIATTRESKTLSSLRVHQVDPLTDKRWGALVDRHPASSVFHTVEWLQALHRTYGYQPTIITTSSPGAQLQNGWPFCHVKSWATGRRLVSLPFSDYCEPLMDDPADTHMCIRALERSLVASNLLYVEFRALHDLGDVTSLSMSSSPYISQKLDLALPVDAIFRNFHKDSTQRKIRRAEREGLTHQEGRSESLLETFYNLLLPTRRRHQVPPQPRRWFENLIECFGEALTIRVAFQGPRPTAAILTLRHKDKLFYKYGCSDERFHNLGGMHLLFWIAIQQAKQDGMSVLDFGRSDIQSTGLVTFKERWGCSRSTVNYWRLTPSHNQKCAYSTKTDWKEMLAKRVVSHLPDRILESLGNALYRHVG